MTFLTQNRFPRLWLLMQKTIGGNASKQAMAIEHFRGQKRVLEIGCSVGNVSEVFRSFPNIVFTGIDIDQRALDIARFRFQKDSNFRFELSSIEDLSRKGDTFDYVLFAGILHHVDENTAIQLLRDAKKCLAKDGRLVIFEPEKPKPSDRWILRFFCAHFEQGSFMRPRNVLQHLIENAGIFIESIEDRMVSPGIVKRPYVARFNVFACSPT